MYCIACHKDHGPGQPLCERQETREEKLERTIKDLREMASWAGADFNSGTARALLAQADGLEMELRRMKGECLIENPHKRDPECARSLVLTLADGRVIEVWADTDACGCCSRVGVWVEWDEV